MSSPTTEAQAAIASARPDIAARLAGAGAAVLSLSVLGDSAIEHYRGSFHNPAMTVPLQVGAASLAVNCARAAGVARPRPAPFSDRAAIVAGAAGLAFHAYNIARRPSAPTMNGLFYGAPVGAPAALLLAGTLGALSTRLAGAGRPRKPARRLGLLSAAGLAGSVGEASLLHFRGAFHNPLMWTPLVLPPVTALALARDAVTGRARQPTMRLLAATAVMGLAGAALHVVGVARHMGGWRNWRQNLLDGPPIPAPPAFTGLAVAGLGAWLALRSKAHG